MKKEVKKSTSIRIRPSDIRKIKEEYGSMAKWINQKIKEDIKLQCVNSTALSD